MKSQKQSQTQNLYQNLPQQASQRVFLTLNHELHGTVAKIIHFFNKTKKT